MPPNPARAFNPMPANLTHQYRQAEEAYRRASTPEEELECLQWMLREVPKHKGTDKLQAELKQKISKAKKDLTSGRSSRRGGGVRIPRQGAGRVVLIGAPNTGKSQFVSSVTRATPEVADYPFTTREPLPAMMPWDDVLIQLIDTSPVTRDVMDPHLQGLIRGADLVLLFLDLANDAGLEECQDVLDRLGATRTRLAASTYLDDNDIGLSFTTTFLIANKCDVPESQVRWELFQEDWQSVFRAFVISALTGEGTEPLQAAMFGELDIVRVYTKTPQAKEPDFDKPFTIRRGGTLADIAALVHKDLAKNLRFARVWGCQVHDGTTVKADYVLHDRDIVELHI
ncbi:MAG: 50S ribosome-binding GTPase [Planctomycetales bacterium]|nr:50S ribosome-binding GTPase [Planctomycetales bacterium]